jgi:hypothetical protein
MAVEDLKAWTIMIYMAGDNSLSTEMAYTLQQIKNITDTNNDINLLVYYDGFSSNVPTIYCDFSDSKLPVRYYRSYKIEDKLIKRESKFENAFNENSASMNNIINFVDWCINKVEHPTKDGKGVIKGRKARNYAMILSGHSFGFLDWGLFKDEKADFHMTLSKLKWVFERITFDQTRLEEIAKKDIKREQEIAEKNEQEAISWSAEKYAERTQVILGKPFDLLGFDSCVMSTLEIGSQFKGLANTMVASEGSVPSAGWNYAQILLSKITESGAGAKIDTHALAINFVDRFIKQQNSFALADISVDMAAWDLTSLYSLEKSFGTFSENLFNCFDTDDTSDTLVFNQTKRLLAQVHSQCQTYIYEQHVDLGDFCQLLHTEIDLLKNEIDNTKISPIIALGDSCKKVADDIKNCILISGFSGSDFQFSNGISLFFPWSLESYESAQKDYEKLFFISDSEAGKKWNGFLKKYLSEVTFRVGKQPTDSKDGKLNISEDTSSIVYETYNFLDEVKNLPNISGASQTDDKQPPNATRQPPNATKLFSAMGIFLSRFMRLKNFKSNWNRAGFTCNPNKVMFFEKDPKDTKGPENPNHKTIIEIDKGDKVQEWKPKPETE